jgi:hypothetical protein
MNDENVEILLRSVNGIFAPQSNLYFSTSSKILLSCHPTEIIEEIFYTFCPQCCTKFSDDDAFEMKCICNNCNYCGFCEGILINVLDNLYCTSCSHNFSDIENSNSICSSAFQALFDDLSLDHERSSNKPSLDQYGARNWSLDKMEQHLFDKSKYNSSKDSLQNFRLLSEVQNVKPSGIPLRGKKTLRCIRDIEAAANSNMLVRPKPFPLDGDSSMKVQTGDWWDKDSSSIHILPFI